MLTGANIGSTLKKFSLNKSAGTKTGQTQWRFASGWAMGYAWHDQRLIGRKSLTGGSQCIICLNNSITVSKRQGQSHETMSEGSLDQSDEPAPVQSVAKEGCGEGWGEPRPYPIGHAAQYSTLQLKPQTFILLLRPCLKFIKDTWYFENDQVTFYFSDFIFLLDDCLLEGMK